MKDLTRSISEKRQKLIAEKEASPIIVGEEISVAYNALNSWVDKTRSHHPIDCIVLEINDTKLKVRYKDNSSYKDTYEINLKDVVGRHTGWIGSNPFDEKMDSIRPVNFVLSSILFNLNILGEKSHDYHIGGILIGELNLNPFIKLKNGEKRYYQRPLVWSLSDKQLLIDSIYNGIDCGKILVRLNSWEKLKEINKEGEKELFFRDLVDGKQRLDAVRGFILCEYPDSQGNYFSDLSSYSQYLFSEHQLFSYAEMPENTTDEDVIHQFLKLNFAGVPQSKEHIEFVKSLKSLV